MTYLIKQESNFSTVIQSIWKKRHSLSVMMNRFLLARREKRKIKQRCSVGTENFSMNFYMVTTLPFSEDPSENVLLRYLNALGISFIV